MEQKLLTILLGVLIFVGCTDQVSGPVFRCLEANDHFFMNDGELARIVQISDDRCPCFADCGLAGQIGLTILVGRDTLLADYDGYGFGEAIASSDPEDFVYRTRRGGRIRVLDYGPKAQNCPGTVRQQDFCLQIELLE